MTRVIIRNQTLRQMLEDASHALPVKTVLPVLKHFRLEARGGKLIVIATNLETTVIASREAITVDGEAAALVPAKPFLQFVKALHADTVTLTFHTPREVEVTGGKVAMTFGSHHDLEDFPPLPKVEGVRVVVDAEALREAIFRVAFAAREDPSRPVLEGVLLQPDGERRLIMAATDGYRMAIQELQTLESVSPPQDWILPAKPLLGVGKMLRRQKYRGWVVIDASFPPEGEYSLPYTAFRWAGTCVVLNNISGTYPNWRQVVEGAETVLHVHVQRKALAEALKAIRPALPDSNLIVLRVNGGGLEVTTRSGDVGETRTVVPAVIPGMEEGEYTVGANWHYVNDLVKALGVSSLDLDIGLPPRETMPIVFATGEDYRYLLMPMRLTE